MSYPCARIDCLSKMETVDLSREMAKLDKMTTKIDVPQYFQPLHSHLTIDCLDKLETVCLSREKTTAEIDMSKYFQPSLLTSAGAGGDAPPFSPVFQLISPTFNPNLKGTPSGSEAKPEQKLSRLGKIIVAVGIAVGIAATIAAVALAILFGPHLALIGLAATAVLGFGAAAGTAYLVNKVPPLWQA